MDIENPKTEKPKLSPLALSAVQSGEQYDVGQETLIGREIECNISLNSPHVSRYHAKIVVDGDGASIEDLNSSNGTYVNGHRIQARTPISIGDEIRFDDLAFRLTTPEAGTSEATVMISRDAILKAVQQAQSAPLDATLQSGPPQAEKPPTTPMPAVDEATLSPPPEVDEDHTRMLSSEQINKIASINQHFQKFVDTGSGPRLIASTAPIRGKVFPLAMAEEDAVLSIGRSKESDICISDPSVSRTHARIHRSEGRFHIETADDDKTVLVNGHREHRVMLKHNDQLQIGHVEFVFRLDEQDVDDNPILNRPEKRPENKEQSRMIMVIAIVAALLAIALMLKP